jgi:hypothetical protein
MKKVTENLISIFIGCLILFFGVKSCMRTTTPIIEKVEKYKITMPNGEIDEIYLCPNNALIYSKKKLNFEDWGVFKMQRNNVIHYFGGLYNIDADGTPLGIRYYSDIDYAIDVHLAFKFSSGNVAQSTFSNIVEYDEIFKFSNNSNNLEINGDQYTKQEVSEEENNKIAILIKNLK